MMEGGPRARPYGRKGGPRARREGRVPAYKAGRVPARNDPPVRA